MGVAKLSSELATTTSRDQYDADQNLVVMAKAGSNRQTLTDAVLEIVRASKRSMTNRRGGPIEVRFATVQYGFEELARARDAIAERIWDIPAVTQLDLHESRNRVVIGRKTGTPDVAIFAVTDGLGISRSMIGFQDIDGVELTQSSELREPFRPIIAGVQGVAGCTIGAAALRDNTPVFITASHCTAINLQPDGGPFAQPRFVDVPGVVEWIDPYRYACGTFFNPERCAHADAAAYGTNDASLLGLGKIAQPLRMRRWDDPTYYADRWLVDDRYSTFRIIGELDTFYEGEQLDKVGSETGWTYGPVRQTCVDVRAPDAKFVCQDIVELDGEGGDSGSPVFLLTYGDPWNDVYFAGILWACLNTCASTTQMYMSNTGQIRQRIGGSLVFH